MLPALPFRGGGFPGREHLAVALLRGVEERRGAGVAGPVDVRREGAAVALHGGDEELEARPQQW